MQSKKLIRKLRNGKKLIRKLRFHFFGKIKFKLFESNILWLYNLICLDFIESDGYYQNESWFLITFTKC